MQKSAPPHARDVESFGRKCTCEIQTDGGGLRCSFGVCLCVSSVMPEFLIGSKRFGIPQRPLYIQIRSIPFVVSQTTTLFHSHYRVTQTSQFRIYTHYKLCYSSHHLHIFPFIWLIVFVFPFGPTIVYIYIYIKLTD